MADLNSLIAQGAQFNIPDQLGQFAKMQQIQQGMQQQQLGAQQMQTSALQQKAAEFQLQKLQEDHANMIDLSQKLSQQGLTPRQFFEALQGSKDPQRQQAGIEGLMKLAETEKYDAYLRSKQTIPAQQPGMPVSGALGTGRFGLDQTPGAIAPAIRQANALAPQAAPAAADPVAAIDAEIASIKNFADPRAKDDLARLQKQRDELVKPHVVGRNLVTGAGQKIFEAPQDVTPTNLSRLMAERNALPPNDPQRKLYDAAISKETYNASAADLAFRKTQDEWNKKNPGFQLEKVDLPDGSVQFVGVDKRTLVATPIMTAPPAGAMPPAAPAGAGRGSVGVTDMRTGAGVPLISAAKPKEAPAKFHDIDIQLAGLAGSLKQFKDEVNNMKVTGASFLPKGEDTARMQAKYTALLMGLKDLYTLGALTGPDMSIIESQITNPASWTGKFTSDAGIRQQTKVIEDMLNRSAANVENSYGRKPNATSSAMQQLKPSASTSADGEWKVVK